MPNSASIKLLLSDPGVSQARQSIENMKKLGVDVFYNPSELMIVGKHYSNPPSRSAMDAAFPLHHEIGLLFALQTLAQHYQTMAKAAEVIDIIRHSAKK